MQAAGDPDHAAAPSATLPDDRVLRRGTANVTALVIAAYAHWAEAVLFVWVLANQSGVPIPVVPALLGAGALAGSGGLSVVVTLAVSVAATIWRQCRPLLVFLLHIGPHRR